MTMADNKGMTMADNKDESVPVAPAPAPSVGSSSNAAVQFSRKDLEEPLNLKETELKSEIEKVKKARQDYSDKKNNILQSNPPQGPNADYGADMWKLFDVYLRAGQLFGLSFYENKLEAVQGQLQPCLTQIEEIKKFKQDKENKGEPLNRDEIVDIEQRLEKIDARMEVLANISRKVTGEPDKDGNAATLSDSSYALEAAGNVLYGGKEAFKYFGGGIKGGIGAFVLGGLYAGVVTPLAVGLGAVKDIFGGLIEAGSGKNVENSRALENVELETKPLNKP